MYGNFEHIFDYSDTFGTLFVYAEFEDGHIQEISTDINLLVTFPETIFKISTLNNGYRMVSVPENGIPIDGRYGEIYWSNCNGKIISPQGAPYIKITGKFSFFFFTLSVQFKSFF
jgi:hypothetical protein